MIAIVEGVYIPPIDRLYLHARDESTISDSRHEFRPSSYQAYGWLDRRSNIIIHH